jgi:hypothetical protein
LPDARGCHRQALGGSGRLEPRAWAPDVCPTVRHEIIVKIARERLLFLGDFWGSCAINFGAGYVLLSNLKRGLAIPIALILVTAGFIARLVIKSKRKANQ